MAILWLEFMQAGIQLSQTQFQQAVVKKNVQLLLVMTHRANQSTGTSAFAGIGVCKHLVGQLKQRQFGNGYLKQAISATFQHFSVVESIV